MQLNYESREKLRKEVEKKLALVPEGERIKLPKEILEQLIFEVEKYPIENGETLLAKFLVWSGDFLRKVDLSEVSFEDVVWDCDIEVQFLDIIKDGEDNRQSSNRYVNVSEICLAGTNAKINFYKSAEYKFSKNINIGNCDFSGVDLSNNVFDVEEGTYFNIDQSNFDDTGIRFIGSTEGIYDRLCIYNTSFKRTNFLNCTFTMDYLDGAWVEDANFYNSGLKIDFEDKKPTVKMIEYLEKYRSIFKKYQFNPYRDNMNKFYNLFIKELGYDEAQKILRFWLDNFQRFYVFNTLLNKGYLEGCSVNGKKVYTEKERETKKSQMLSVYQEYEDEQINSILANVETAIKATRKK